MATGNGSKAVRLYDVRTDEGEWIGRFVVTDDGYFSTVSEWGNYAFWWNSAGENFRKFLVGIGRDPSYLLSKLSSYNEYDGERTVAAVRKHIKESRKAKHMTAEEARVEWDLINDNSSLESREWFGRWYEDTKIGDAFEFMVTDYPAQARHFAVQAYPHFVKVLSEELANERQAHACEFCT